MDRKPLKIGDLTARIPVIQGGMGVGISLSHLAGSVAANGGVGILSAAQIGFREPDFEEHPKEANLRAIQSQLAKARALAGGGIVGFNIMVATKDYADYVKAAVKAGADLINFRGRASGKTPGICKRQQHEDRTDRFHRKSGQSDAADLEKKIQCCAGSVGDRRTKSRRTSGLSPGTAGNVYG